MGGKLSLKDFKNAIEQGKISIKAVIEDKSKLILKLNNDTLVILSVCVKDEESTTVKNVFKKIILLECITSLYNFTLEYLSSAAKNAERINVTHRFKEQKLL